MARQSISFTKPNDDWLNAQVKNQEFSSKSEAVNDLIRKERRKQEEIDWIRAKLIEGEQSGRSQRTPEQIREEVREELRANDEL